MESNRAEGTASTIVRNIARLSSEILGVLDEHAPQYFELAEEESVTLQIRIERAARVCLVDFADEITAGCMRKRRPPPSRRR